MSGVCKFSSHVSNVLMTYLTAVECGLQTLQGERATSYGFPSLAP